MNRRNNWEGLLKLANEDVATIGYKIKITDEEDRGFYKCLILKDGKVVDTYAENFYEDELEDLVNEVWYHIKNNL